VHLLVCDNQCIAKMHSETIKTKNATLVRINDASSVTTYTKQIIVGIHVTFEGGEYFLQ
jgi:hypothetical protein